MVCRDLVLEALQWLKKYNKVYKDIELQESNLDWMEGSDESDIRMAVDATSTKIMRMKDDNEEE